MTSDDKRVESEESFHDRIAVESEDSYSIYYRFDVTKDMREAMFDQIGDLGDKLVLDFGCGSGWFSVFLAQRGAKSIGIDISRNLLRNAVRAAEKNDVEERVLFCHMNAENMALQTDQFDFIIGNAILHHLDLEKAIHEIHRVLKPGGVAYFIEPMAYNPLVNLYRRFTPDRRTVDERPFTRADINLFKKKFERSRFEFHHFFSLLAFFWLVVIKSDGMFVRTFNLFKKLDRLLINRLPGLKLFSWIVFLRLEK